MKYGMMRWMVMIVAAAGLTLGGCSRQSETAAVPLDQFVRNPGSPDPDAGGSAVSIRLGATSTEIAQISNPQYQVLNGTVVPNRQTSLSVAMQGKFNLAATSSPQPLGTSATPVPNRVNRMLVFADRVPWGTALDSNGTDNTVSCAFADTLVIDTGFTTDAAVDPDIAGLGRFEDGVSVCGEAASANCLNLGIAVGGALTPTYDGVTGFINHSASGVRGNAQPTNGVIPANSNASTAAVTGICEAVVPVRITASGSDRGWSTLTNYPVLLNGSDFWVTFRFEFFGGNSNATAPLLATTLPAPACVGGCFDPSLTLQANVTGVNDFPFTFDALPPRIDASSYTRASNTITLATGGGGSVTVNADVASSITINGTVFSVVEVGGVIADPLTDFEYIDADGDTAVNDTDANAQAFVDLINRHPVLGGVIAHQAGGVITVTATERGTAGNGVALITVDANEVTYVIGGGGTNLEGGTDGPATVGPLVTGGIPRQLPYGPIGYLQSFDDLSTTSGLPVVTAGSQNFVSRNVQGNDLITFLSDGNNGRTRVIAGVSVEKSVEADAGSSATVIVDANTLLSSMPSDGILVGGTVTGQTGTPANVGVTRTIVASDTTLGTLTVSPAFPAAVAPGDTLLIRQGGAAVSPSLLGLTASVPADSSAAQYLIAHADVQALRPRETGGNVVIEDVRFASANSAVVTGTIQEGRPAVIIFTGADSIPFNLNDELAFVTAQSGAASNRIRIQFTDTGTLGVTIAEWPASYIGGPDNPATPADDENDLIININYDAGTTTQVQVAAAVASHPVARRFVQAIPLGGPVAVTAAVDGLINPPPPGSPPLNPATEGALIPGIGSDIAQITVRGVNQVTGAIQTRSAVITRSQSAIDPTLATAVYEDIDLAGVPVANTAIRFYARTAGAAANGVEIDIQDGGALDVTADDGVNLTIEAPAGTTADEIVEFVNEGSRGSRQVNSADGPGGRNDILFENVLSGSDAATGYAVSTQILDGATPGVTVTQVGVNPVNVTVIINRGTGGTTLRAAEVVSLVNTHPVAQLFVRASLATGPTTLAEPVAAVGANPRTTFNATTLDPTNGFYVAGSVTFTTGANAGETRQIISYTGASQTIVVSPGFTNDISVADQFTLVNTNDGQRLFEPANDGVPVAMAGQSGRSAYFKAMHDAGSTGTGAYDLTAGALGPVFTFGGSDPSALLGFVGRIKSSNANIVVGQYSGGECNPSFTDLVMSGHSSLCFTATIPIAEGGTVFDIQATDGSGNLTSDIAQTALLGNPLACSAIVPGDTTPDRCEIVDGAATANLQVVRDVTPPILIADSQDPAYDTTRYEAAASIDCTAPPPGNFCNRPVFVLPADAPAGGGSFTSFSPTVSVGGHVIDYTSTTTAFDTEAAGRTLVRVQSDNNYDSFASPGAGSLDEHGNPVPYTDGDAGVDNGFFRYGNISLRTGALTNFTVTAWDQAGNTTSFSFSVRQFEGNINTPPHFAIDCVVEDTPALVTSATADGNTPPRAIMCENDANSSNPNTPIVVRSLDMSNSANPGGRFGDFVGEQGPSITTGLLAQGGTNATTVVGPATAAISTASDFFHVGDLITFTDGLAVGQTRTVTAYNAGTSTFTVAPAFSQVPGAGDTFTLASFGHYDAATGTATMVDTLDALSTVPTNPVDVDNGAVAGLSTVDDAYVGGTLTVENAGTAGTCAVGLVLTVTDYVAVTGEFSVTTTAAACDLDTDAQLVLRHGDGRNYRSVGALDTLGAGVMPQLDFRTVRSDRIFLQGRTLSLDALPPTVYLGADPTIVKVSGDLMPADGNGAGNPARDFLTLAVAGGNGSSVISIADDVFVTDNLRPGDFISLSSLQGSQSPNVGLFRITACEALDVTGTFCEGLAPFDLTLDKPLPADALGMFVQSAYVWSAPNVSVPVEGINSYLFIAIDSVLSDPNDPLSGNQTVVPFAVIRDTLPPAIVIQGVVNNQDSVAANPIVFITDQTLFLGSSSTLPAQHRSFIAVTRLDNNGEDENNVTAHQRGDYRIFADRLTGNSENTVSAAQSLLATQTSLGQAQAALLTGDVPARPLDVDLSCGDNHADGDDQCRPGQDMAYRVEVAANDRVGRSSVAAVQFNIVESAVDRLLSGALGIISSNPAVVSLISDPTELRTLTLDQLSNSGVLYNLNFHTSLLLGAPNDTVASNPRQAFYLDSRTDFAIVLGTLLQDVDGTGPADSTVVILANVGRILLDNGVLDDLLPLLDDQAIINPRARENFPGGPRTDPGDATLSSIFLEEIMRDPAEAATPCNVGVNQYNCYDDPGTVKNTLPMVKNALDSKQSLRMRATDVTAANTNTLNARVSGIDLIINPVPVAGESVCDSATGGFLPVSNPGEEDSFINTQPGDYIEIVTGACAGGRARVTVVNSDTQIQTEPFRGVYTSTEDGGITATTLTDSTTIGHDPGLYTGQTLRILSGVNVLQTATVTSFDDVTGEFTFAAGCVPGPCAVSGAGDAYTVNQLLSTACTSVGGCEGAGCAFRVVPPQGPSMEPIFDLADHLLFMDLDNDGRFGEREVISSLMHLIEESMANPQEGMGPAYVGSYPTAADRYSLVCPATGICPNTLADIQDAPSLQGMMDLIYELSDNDNPADGVEFISRLLNLVRAAISEYPREATNPLAPRGATVLEAVSFITRDLLSDEIGSTGLMAEPLAAIANPDYELLTSPDDRQNSRMNLLMRSTYIMGPNGVSLPNQTITLKNGATTTVNSVLTAVFPLLHAISDDPDDNPRGIPFPPFTFGVQQSVLEKLLPAIELVLRDNRLEDVIDRLAEILDPGTNVSDLTAFDYVNNVRNTGYADQPPNPYTVNPPILRVITELGGATIDPNLGNDPAQFRTSLDYTTDALNVLLTRVGKSSPVQENVSADGTSVNTKACSEAYFAGRTPIEVLLNVVAQLVETAPKDPRHQNFRDNTCGSFNPGDNRQYVRVLIDGLFDDPNTQDFEANDIGPAAADDIDDYPGNPVGAYNCGGARGPNGGDGIAVDQAALDILPEVINTALRFGYDSQDRINSIFAECDPAQGDTLTRKGGCYVNNGYPNGTDERLLSVSRLGIDLAMILDAPFAIGSGGGLIRFEQSVVREALEQIAVMSATDAVNYILLLTLKIAEDIQPINGTLTVPDPQDITRSTAAARALADPDGDGNPAPDGVIDDIIPVVQALGASGLAQQILDLLRAVRACGVDDAPGANGRDIKGGELLKSSEDLTLILLDAFSGARGASGNNDGTNRTLVTETPEAAGGVAYCPATPDLNGIGRGFTGGPLDQNPAREEAEALAADNATTTVRGDTALTTLSTTGGFYTGGLITFLDGPAAGETRRITNYALAAGTEYLFTFDALSAAPVAGNRYAVTLSSVNVGVLMAGNDLALTGSDDNAGDVGQAEARNWGAIYSEALPPSTTNFNAGGVGPGAFLCIETRGADQPGGYDEACAPLTARPGTTAPNLVATNDCAADGTLRNCVTFQNDVSAPFLTAYDDIQGYMALNCNQRRYAVTGGTDVTIVVGAGDGSLATIGVNAFTGQQLVFVTDSTDSSVLAGDVATITANTAGPGPITFTVTGLDLADDPTGGSVRLFGDQSCSYRVRQMREPYNGCVGGDAIGGEGLGLALSSFGGPTPLPVNPFRDSRMDLLLRTLDHLHRGVNAVDTGGGAEADYSFFDRAVSLITFVVQPNPDNENNRSMAENLIFGANGFEETEEGPVQRMLNDGPTRSALSAVTTLFARLTAATGAPTLDSVTETVTTGDGAAPFDTFVVTGISGTYPADTDLLGRAITFTSGANTGVTAYVTAYDPGTDTITVTGVPAAIGLDDFIVQGREDRYDRYPNFVDASGWPTPAGADCSNTGIPGCDGNAINDAVDYQLLALSGLLGTLGDRDGRDDELGANAVLPGHSREGFSDDPRLLFSVLTQFIQTDLIRQLIPGIQILTEQTDLVPPAARDTKSTVVDDNNTLHGLEIDGLALANIISRSARSNNGDESGLLYDSRPYVPGTYAAGQQRVILAGATAVDGIYEGPTQALVRTILGVLDDFEQAIDYTNGNTGNASQPAFDNVESLNNKRYRNKLVAMQDLLANLMGSVRDGIEHPFNTQNYLGQALRLVRDIATDTDTVVTPSGHDRTIDNILSVQVGLAQRDIIDTPTGAGDFYRSGLDVVGNFINTLIEDPTDCNTATADFDRGVNAAVTYDACVDFNPQAVFRDRGVLVERPLQPILREDLFSSLSVLLAGDAESKVIGALPFISGIIGSQLYALDNDPVSGTGPIDPTDLGNAPGCGSGAVDREFCGQEYTTGVTIADALFADIQALIPGSASVNPRIVREDDENRYDPLITDDLNRNGTIGDAALAGVFDTTFGGGAPWMSVFDDPAVAACVTNCPSTEVDNIVFDCSPPAGFPAGSPLEACTDGASGDPEVAGTPAGYTDRRFRIGFTAADGVVTLGNLNGINAALFDGLADLIAREDYAFIVNNQVPRTSTPLQSMDQLTIRELDISTGLPVDPAFVDLLTALGDLLIDSNVGN